MTQNTNVPLPIHYLLTPKSYARFAGCRNIVSTELELRDAAGQPLLEERTNDRHCYDFIRAHNADHANK